MEDDNEYKRTFSKVVSEVISRDTEFARLQTENDAFKHKSILKENEERDQRIY